MSRKEKIKEILNDFYLRIKVDIKQKIDEETIDDRMDKTLQEIEGLDLTKAVFTDKELELRLRRKKV